MFMLNLFENSKKKEELKATRNLTMQRKYL